LTSEQDRIWARHEVYMQERMKLMISDRQYLWWDDVFASHMVKAVSKYDTLLFHWAHRDSYGCRWFGDYPRANIKFLGKTLTAYRFAYAVATVVPISTKEIVRHECNNPYCVNPRHMLTGDAKDNYRDYLATQAYGTRWKLLRGWDSM